MCWYIKTLISLNFNLKFQYNEILTTQTKAHCVFLLAVLSAKEESSILINSQPFFFLTSYQVMHVFDVCTFKQGEVEY